MNTQITRWNPIKEMEQMQRRMSSLWNWEPFRITADGQEEALTVADWSPRVDIVENEKEFIIKAELPDMKREDVKVTVDEDVLTLSGERRQEKEEKNQRYHRVECEYGSFSRSFTLPPGTVGEKVMAEFKDGILRVHLPKDAKAAASRTIDVKVS